MNDLDLVVRVQQRLSPRCAAHYRVVEFDGNLFGFERQVGDELRE